MSDFLEVEILFSVFCNNVILVHHPITVPLPKCCGVVHANSIDSLDFEPRRLERINKPSKWRRCVCTRKDIFVHKNSLKLDIVVEMIYPNEILELPTFSQSCDLQQE